VLGQGSLIATHGIVVAEHATEDVLEERYGKLALIDSRRYGSTALSLYVCREES
jgi:16S rRNA G966 N2-methylase RsmD